MKALMNMDAGTGPMKAAAETSHFVRTTASPMEQFILLKAVQTVGPSMTKDEVDGAMESLLSIFSEADAAAYECKLRTRLFGGYVSIL